MTHQEKKAMIKMLIQAYRETGNRKFLARALKIGEVKG